MADVEVITADITTLRVDAIVNAANRSLLGGGGVDGAIHRAGGPAILDECRAIVARQGGCATGEVVVTGAGRLTARHVVHAVGPVYADDPQVAPELLASCYRRALAAAGRRDCASIAFPSISTGVFGYPLEDAAAVAMGVLVPHAASGAAPARVIMCCFSESDAAVYEAARAAAGV